MCRILYVRGDKELNSRTHLQQFSEIARNSKEFQGHGWGCSYLQGGQWRHYKNIQPIWEDDLDKFPPTSQLVAHARSAFEGSEITVENNMPFYDDKYVFVFNGELRGVKIKAEGRIGAEKIFNYIKRFDNDDPEAALTKAVSVIENRTDYVKAMNIVLTDRRRAYVASFFSEDPDYFTLHTRSSGDVIVCSEPYPGEGNWQPIANRSIRVF